VLIFKHLDHDKWEVVAARYYDISAKPVEMAARRKGVTLTNSEKGESYG